MTNNDSDNSDTVSNPDSIDDETFPKFLVIINDAIWAAYSGNEKTQEILNRDGLNPYCFGGWLGLMGLTNSIKISLMV